MTVVGLSLVSPFNYPETCILALASKGLPTLPIEVEVELERARRRDSVAKGYGFLDAGLGAYI